MNFLVVVYAHQAPLSMGFYRQEYWSGLLYLPPEDLSNPGIEPESLMSAALASSSLYIHYETYTKKRMEKVK